MKIQRYRDYNLSNEMAFDFINSFDEIIIESQQEDYKSIQKKIISDLKLNLQLVSTFGAGIGALYPIVNSLMKNLNISSIEITPEMIVMLTMASVAIIYVEEKKSKDQADEESVIRDSKSLLEELKMRGVGNGIVKKMMKAIKSIKNIFSIIAKHLGAVVGGIIDMFAYTSLLVPIMNGVLYIVDKYQLNMETMIENFIGLSLGIGTIIAKNGIVAIVNKLKDKFPINKSKVIDEIETPVVQKFSTFGEQKPTGNTEMINEQ